MMRVGQLAEKMVTYQVAFRNVHPQHKRSIFKKLKAADFNVSDAAEVEAAFLGLDEAGISAAQLDMPERCAVRAVLARLKGPPCVKAGAEPALEGDPVLQFWRQLPEAAVADGFLQLPDGCSFFGDPAQGPALLVRTCYSRLAQGVLQLQHEGFRKVTIAGSPGIGKSWFLAYFMHLLVTGNQPILTIVLHTPSDGLLCFHRGSGEASVTTAKLTDLRSVLRDPSTWYLVDGVKPQPCPARTLLVTSSNPETYSQFLKLPKSALRFMPMWSAEELQECRARLHPALPVDAVQQLYGKWGGSARYVLEKAQEREQQVALESAIGQCQMELLQSMGSNSAMGQASDMLLCVKVYAGEAEGWEDLEGRAELMEYVTRRVAFASPYIAERVTRHLLRGQERELRVWLKGARGLAAAALLAGSVYEQLVLMEFSAAKQTMAQCKDLASGAIAPPHRVGYPSFKFSNLQEVQRQGPGTYCKTGHRSLLPVNAIMQPDCLYVTTMSRRRPLPLDGLNKAIRKLDCFKGQASKANSHETKPKVKLFFVVPPPVSAKFKEQPYRACGAQQLLADVQQFAVEVDVGPSSNKKRRRL